MSLLAYGTDSLSLVTAGTLSQPIGAQAEAMTAISFHLVDDTGAVMPGQRISAKPVSAPLFVYAGAGWDLRPAPAPSAMTDVSGNAIITLPPGNTCVPANPIWRIFLPSGGMLTGIVPAGVVQITAMDLLNTYGWALVQAVSP